MTSQTETPKMLTLPQRLRMKADCITMGKRIEFGSECLIMHEAAEEIDRLKRQVEVLREGLEYYKSPSDYVTPLTGGLGKLYFDCGNVAGGALAAADKIEKE